MNALFAGKFIFEMNPVFFLYHPELNLEMIMTLIKENINANLFLQPNWIN